MEEGGAVETWVIGDSGPWARHVAAAWRACAEPGLSWQPPPDPTQAYRRDGARGHQEWLAFWAPLAQLMHFGLGWTRADVGLSRWIEAGRPTEDPVLAVIERWWGPHLQAYLEGAAHSLVMTGSDLVQRSRGGYRRFDESPAEPLPGRRDLGSSRGLWDGGSDVMHTRLHYAIALEPVGGPDRPPAGQRALRPRLLHDGDRRVLLLDRYAGWYRELRRLDDQARTGRGRSLRIEVVCRPVGWLGEYRRSTMTGAWFRCRHRWHTLGA